MDSVAFAMVAKALNDVNVVKSSVSQLASMPVALRYTRLEAVGNTLYVIGGGTTATNTLYAYDILTNTWSSKASMPEVKSGHVTGVSSSGKVYALMGYTTTSTTETGNVYEYDPSTNTWSTKTPSTDRLTQSTSVSYNDKIYVFKGSTDGSYSGAKGYTRIYDTVSNTWSAGPSSTAFRHKQAATLIGTIAYTFCGENENGTDYKTTSTYDVVANSLGVVADSTYTRMNPVAFSLGNKAYLIDGNIAPALVYDPVSGTWDKSTEIQFTSHEYGTGAANDITGRAATVVGNKAYIVGYQGTTGISELYSVTLDEYEALRPVLKAAAAWLAAN